MGKHQHEAHFIPWKEHWQGFCFDCQWSMLSNYTKVVQAVIKHREWRSAD